MVIPFLTVYLTSKGYSIAQAGYVMACFGCGSILGGYIGGRLTDKLGHYYVQVFSLMLNGILFIVLGQMHTLFQFMICIFVLSSLGESFRPANSAAIAAYSNENNRTRCYSLNRLAINVGFAIGPAICRQLSLRKIPTLIVNKTLLIHQRRISESHHRVLVGRPHSDQHFG